jgi:hypothetical protein
LLVDGHYFPHSHPLAVLINGRSASASEMTASALQEYGAAHLFGATTAGAVNAAQIIPLPGQVALEFTVSAVLTGRSLQPLDKVGVSPDEAVSDADDRDASLKAAQAWLAGPDSQVPAPTGARAYMGDALPVADVLAQLMPYGATVDDLPAIEHLTLLGDRVLNTPNEAAALSANAVTLAHRYATNGWQGRYEQVFGVDGSPTFVVTVDQFRDARQTNEAFSNMTPRATGGCSGRREPSKQCPVERLQQSLHPVALPIRLGQRTVAVQGGNATALTWSRGRLVFSIAYISAVGGTSFDPVVRIARALDARYLSNPRR